MTPEELRASIIPRSDQLNADSLLSGPITVTIDGVKSGDKEQPVVICIGNEHQPYKPCKSMRRVLIAAWGDKGLDWIGKSLTLYCDPNVSWAGVKVGGIRISHLSHIDSDRTFMLTTKRGKKEEFHVKKLAEPKKPNKADRFASAKASITEANDSARLDSLLEAVRTRGFSPEEVTELEAAVEARRAQIADQPI